MKFLSAGLGLLLIAAGSFLVYEVRNSIFTFDPTPVHVPLQMLPGTSAKTRFIAGVSEDYDLRLDFMKTLKPVEIGIFDNQLQSTDVSWSVREDSGKTFSGSSKRYPSNWYGSGRNQGRVIGRFPASKGHAYEVEAIVLNVPRELNGAEPHLDVAINMSRLTDYSYSEDARPYVRGLGIALCALGVVAQAPLFMMRKRA